MIKFLSKFRNLILGETIAGSHIPVLVDTTGKLQVDSDIGTFYLTRMNDTTASKTVGVSSTNPDTPDYSTTIFSSQAPKQILVDVLAGRSLESVSFEFDFSGSGDVWVKKVLFLAPMTTSFVIPYPGCNDVEINKLVPNTEIMHFRGLRIGFSKTVGTPDGTVYLRWTCPFYRIS